MTYRSPKFPNSVDIPTLVRVVDNTELTPRNREMCNDYIGTAQKIEWKTDWWYTKDMKRSPLVEVSCKNCEKKFIAPMCRVKAGKKKYCSMTCYNHRKRVITREERECQRCGKKWSHVISQRGGTYCSYDCWNIAKRTRIEKACVCGKTFTTHPNREKSNRGKFCSKGCYWQSLKIDPELRHRNGLEYRRAYRRAHPEKYAMSKHKRRALEAGAEGHFTEEDWFRIKALQNNKCKMCGEEKKLTVDHIKPLSRGGSNHPENIQGLCGICNSRKWAKI